MNEFSVPIGWRKGERLVVSRISVHDKFAWYLELPYFTNLGRDFPPDSIAAIWFFTDEEFTSFMKWWHGIEDTRPDLKAKLVEAMKSLIGGIRSINKSDHHKVNIEGDDEPCYWQREEWIKWILEEADKAEEIINTLTGDEK